MPPFSQTLTPDKALIFRITHRDNLPWILANGLHCQSSGVTDPGFVSIGNPELIDVRRRRVVDIVPGGTLADYIPFYFTPYTPMLYNALQHQDWIRWDSAAPERGNCLVSSLLELKRSGISYVFSDRHAKLETAAFFDDDRKLADAVDFNLLQRRDFSRDPDDRTRSSAIRRRRWHISTCRSPPSSASAATLPQSRASSKRPARIWA